MKKPWGWIALACFIGMIVSFVIPVPPTFFAFLVAAPVCAIIGLAAGKATRAANRERRKENREREFALKEQQKQFQQQHREEVWKAWQSYSEIESVCLIGSNNRKGAVGAAARGVVGGALLGPVGLAAGVVSTKGKNMATFSVRYKSGQVATETVKVGSMRFNELCKYLHE